MMLQYVDRNVGPADYHHLEPDELLVTKVFLTLQSEGPLAGKVAVFVRLAGCDKGDKVSCEFCDTDFRFDQGKVFRIVDLVQEVRMKYTPAFLFRDNSPLIILTGGEPMLQNNIVHLIEAMPAFKFQIESNGDRLARGFTDSKYCDKAMLVVSPKINPRSQRYPKLQEEVLNRADVLKFVVSANKTSPYHTLPPYCWEYIMKKSSVTCVCISPMTIYKRAVEPEEVANLWDNGLVDHEATKANYAYAASMCIKYGYHFSHQSHLLTGVE
jgi:7-carboxy-7-deazaguanine synthase